MQGPKQAKLDLICNKGVDIWNQEELLYGYHQGGSVYLGAKEAIGPSIFEKNIRAVLTVMDRKSYQKQKIKDKLQDYGLLEHHMLIVAEDSKDVQLKGHYQQAYSFIQNHLKEDINVLVHCKGGRSRSAAILCSYLIKKHNLPFDKCYQLVKSRRPVVSINAGFEKELKLLGAGGKNNK